VFEDLSKQREDQDEK
jgi:septal ring factor EnvC (AmiA/AmiB activator)